jgi:hypothetical protein
MRGFPRRSMLRLAQAIMIACDAAPGTALRAEGDSVPFYPLGLRRCTRLDYSYRVPRFTRAAQKNFRR